MIAHTTIGLLWLGAGMIVGAYPEGEPQVATPAGGSITAAYEGAAKRIVDAAMAKNDAYLKMEELCDGIGHRLAGSPGLDKALRWAAATLAKDGMENVRLEPVTVPHWVRGQESLTLLEPRSGDLPILGLGGSVGTGADGITAPVVTAGDKEHLDRLGDSVKGKIVLFNHPMPPYDPQRGSGYGSAVRYRYSGARWAAEKGAVACLVRSATAVSLRSPHTGAMGYGDSEVKIPTACVTIEDAEMLARLNARGIFPIVNLKMEAENRGTAPSANVVAELRGTEKPDEVVVIGGHIDSWDVGQGAHDDATGCVMAMEAVNLLKKLGLVPRRTIRVVLWANEEFGLSGGKEYAKAHEAELVKHIAAIESDEGGFRPTGYRLECTDENKQSVAAEQMREILGMLSSIGSLDVKVGGSAADVSPMRSSGVILMGHGVENSTYFNYHHTRADTLDKVDRKELSQNVAVMATVAYILADMPQRFGEK